MKPKYKNWMPINVLVLWTTISVVSIALSIGLAASPILLPLRIFFGIFFGILSIFFLYFTVKFYIMRAYFSYDGKQQLSRKIIESTADYIKLEKRQSCLDIGCGSASLSNAIAKRNPEATVTGLDMWGKTYEFSKALCENNAKAENLTNVSFVNGDARKLDFPDETFDAVTSNYVYHNIPFGNRQELLMETFRVLKKGGTFAIHDLMTKAKYGDMDAFIKKLKDHGFSEVKLLPTTDGLFMSKKVANTNMLIGSFLLTGIK